MMVGAVLLGGLADKLGRKQCLIISLAINAAFAFLSSFVQGYGFFLFYRLISGLGWVPGEPGPCPGGAPAQLGSVGWDKEGCSGDASLVLNRDGIAI